MTNLIRHYFFTLLACTFFIQASAQVATAPAWVKKVGARSFPSAKTIYTVNNYGAVSDTVTVNTKAIQKAIDECAAKGGGIVVFKPGTYITGALFLKITVQPPSAEGV